MGNLPLNQNGIGTWKKPAKNLMKKDSRSTFDIREDTDILSYMVTGAFESQKPNPEFLTGQIQPSLQIQEYKNQPVTLPFTQPNQYESLFWRKDHKTLSITWQMFK